jgi:pantothenate kinase type III
MILVVDVGNTRIKAAVLRGYPLATFCFLWMKSSEKYKNI